MPMPRSARNASIVLAVFLLFASSASADGTKISGLAFGDFYYVSANHNAAFEGNNGFWLRRAYLTFDQTISEVWDVRARFEMNSLGDFSTTPTRITPFVKDLYLRYKKGDTQVLVGLVPTPTWDVADELWGYRPVERTPADLYKMGNSRDLGIGVKGAKDKFQFHFVVGNGSDLNQETNKGKKIYGALNYLPNEFLTFQIYGDYEKISGNLTRSTFQGMAVMKRSFGRVGLMYDHQSRNGLTPAVNLDVVSVFGVFNLKENFKAIARYDRSLKPNPDGSKVAYLPFDTTAKSNFFLLGLDWALHKNVSVIPNVEIITYDQPSKGSKPNSDVMPRITFSCKF